MSLDHVYLGMHLRNLVLVMITPVTMLQTVQYAHVHIPYIIAQMLPCTWTVTGEQPW